MKDYDPVEIEEKWQNIWEKKDIDAAKVDESREPFYLIFAYPGVSGFLHLGHMRCYSYTDIIARYKRMTGYNVLFPTGTHPTGNQAISLSKQLREGNEEKIAYMKRNGASEEDIERMKDPQKLISYLNEVYIEKYWKKFGVSIDFDYFTYTTREDYKQFITWQFKKLMEKDLLTQKPYFGTECIECGPVAVDPSETDLSKGGTAEKQEYTLLKFEYGDRYITAATLRPETVFGQTNLWVDPEEEYVVADVEGEEWILSRAAVEKLKYQKDDIEIVDTIKGKEMIGDHATAPAIQRDIIILPATFTDPDVGTGIVTSVPSDAPYDWIALKDIKENEVVLERYDLKEKIQDVEPIEIIESDEWGVNPAERIIEEMEIESQEDQEKLEKATQKIYKAGCHTGTMLDVCGEYAGMRVQQAKDMVKEDMIRSGEADILYDLSEEVICRCGEVSSSLVNSPIRPMPLSGCSIIMLKAPSFHLSAIYRCIFSPSTSATSKICFISFLTSFTYSSSISASLDTASSGTSDISSWTIFSILHRSDNSSEKCGVKGTINLSISTAILSMSSPQFPPLLKYQSISAGIS